jgi:hypothetical protein
MTCSVHDPLLGDCLPIAIVLNGSRIGVTIRHFALLYPGRGVVPFDALGQQFIAIAWMNGRVAIAMEHDDRDRSFAGVCSAVAFISVLAAKSFGFCLQPCSMTISGSVCPS